MAGLSGKPKAETSAFYGKLISLLAEECSEWLKSLDDD
jgi:hypothetical protein